ncbi:MAG: AraC family transcriptional regulator [Deltaproteobacteria bacterium]|nr:AraC family transcriptional regulator [Deltaproteobacteria bacterium]
MDLLTDWLASAGTSLGMLVRARLALPWGMKLEPHGEVMFHVVVGGSCWVRTPSVKPRRLHQGDMVLLPHGDGHELADEAETPAVALPAVLGRAPPARAAPATTLLCGTYSLEDRIARPLLRSLPRVVVFSAERVRAHPPLGALLALLTREVDQPQPGGDVLVRHLLDALFIYVVRAWLAEDAAGPTSWLAALRDQPVANALSRMHAEPARNWTVQGLARVAGLSRAAFARRFAGAMGEPPLTYLARWRMGLAARLLVESDASLAEVATRVGYESEFAFSRAFKRIRGRAPGAFRRAAA